MLIDWYIKLVLTHALIKLWTNELGAFYAVHFQGLSNNYSDTIIIEFDRINFQVVWSPSQQNEYCTITDRLIKQNVALGICVGWNIHVSHLHFHWNTYKQCRIQNMTRITHEFILARFSGISISCAMESIRTVFFWQRTMNNTRIHRQCRK